jgi:hypothetical protein
MSKPRKYEGKRIDRDFNNTLAATCSPCAIDCCCAELSVFFILGVEVSQKCSQLIHMRFVPSSPAGLRVEIRVKIDKKKIEFYFS